MPTVPAWLAWATYAHRPLSSSVEAAEGLHGLGAPEAEWPQAGMGLLGGAGQLPGTCLQKHRQCTLHSPAMQDWVWLSTGTGGSPSLSKSGLHNGSQVQTDEDCCGPRSPLWEEQQPTAHRRDGSQASKVRLQDGVPRAGLRFVALCSRGEPDMLLLLSQAEGTKPAMQPWGVEKTSPPPSTEAGNDRQRPCLCKNRTRLKS